MEKYLVPFSKGPRMCLGVKYVDFPILSLLSLIHILQPCLGRAVSNGPWFQALLPNGSYRYLIFGNIFRKLEMELYDTTFDISVTFYLEELMCDIAGSAT